MRIIFVPILSMLLLIASCKTSKDSDFNVKEGEIISIISPKNTNSSEDVKIDVVFTGLNGCSQGYNIKAEKVGQTIVLRAYYSFPNDGRACTEILPTHKLTYTFFADLPGTYFFQSAQNNLIADTLVVY